MKRQKTNSTLFLRTDNRVEISKFGPLLTTVQKHGVDHPQGLVGALLDPIASLARTQSWRVPNHQVDPPLRHQEESKIVRGVDMALQPASHSQ